MKTPEQVDPDWARYAETVLRFGGDPLFEIDLRDKLDTDVRANFEKIGLTGTFAVMTAHDPYGRDLCPEENKSLQKRLEDELTANGVRFVRVDACSIDRKHCECSVAIDIDQKRAAEIASRYEQMAIFWYDGESMWLIGAVVESDPIRLPRSA